MIDLAFAVRVVEVAKNAATPTLTFSLEIQNGDSAARVRGISLNCQFQIQTGRRHYLPEEQAALADVFGEPERWATTLRPLFWNSVSFAVPAFQDRTTVDLRVPCTFDFNLATTKYFYAVRAGEVPVSILFSGSVFYAAGGSVQMTPIPWAAEASCRIPAALWHEMMNFYYPRLAWLQIDRDVFERLCRLRVRRGLPTWEKVMEAALSAMGEERA